MRLVVQRYALSLAPGVRLGTLEHTSRAGVWVALHADDGQVGYGEAAPPYWIDGSDLDALEGELRDHAAAGGPARDFQRAASAPLEPTATGLSAAARCAVETACLDLIARRRGVALSTWLGGSNEARIDAAALVSGDTPAAVAAHARRLRQRGFRVLKLKVGTAAPSTDIARIEAARDGGGVLLRLDANRAWSEEAATEVLTATAAPDIEYVEEPLHSHDLNELVRLRRRTGVPLAMDESVGDTAALTRLAECGVCDTLVVKLARVGGPIAGLQLGRQARALGLRVVVTDSIESGIGRAAALHVAAALPPPHQAIGLGGAHWLLGSADGDDEPVLQPRGPGLGRRFS